MLNNVLGPPTIADQVEVEIKAVMEEVDVCTGMDNMEPVFAKWQPKVCKAWVTPGSLNEAVSEEDVEGYFYEITIVWEDQSVIKFRCWRTGYEITCGIWIPNGTTQH
jgi:hypothetical protein